VPVLGAVQKDFAVNKMNLSMNVMGPISARTFLLKKPIPSGMTVKSSQGQEDSKEAHIDVFCPQVSCQPTPKMLIYVLMTGINPNISTDSVLMKSSLL
jgi:hypothetical protein